MTKQRKVRYEERPSRASSGVSAVVSVGFLAVGLPMLALFGFAYMVTGFWLLLFPLGFMVFWNGMIVANLLFSSYHAAGGDIPPTSVYERVESDEED